MILILTGIIVSLKFIIPVLMLRTPFYGAWAYYFLDVVDGDILLQLGMTDSQYQTIDKSADLVSYIFMLIVGLRWRIRNTIAVLFVYRFIGQMLFFMTRDERMFIYFQNFLEPLFLIYVVIMFKQKSEEKAYAVYKNNLVFIWALVFAYKIWNEWYLHYANIDLSLLLFGVTGGKM